MDECFIGTEVHRQEQMGKLKRSGCGVDSVCLLYTCTHKNMPERERETERERERHAARF